MEIPDIEKRGGGGGSNRFLVPILIVIITGGFGFWIFTSFHFPGMNTSNSSAAANADDKDFIDFAEYACITLNNISFTNQSQQRSDLAAILSDDMLTLYNKYFYDPDFLRLIADRKLYVSFQKIERSSMENRSGNSAAVKIIGFNTYHSDLTNTQAEYPFSLMIQVEKQDNGKMLVTKIKRL
jgi:hypothetical protein